MDVEALGYTVLAVLAWEDGQPWGLTQHDEVIMLLAERGRVMLDTLGGEEPESFADEMGRLQTEAAAEVGGGGDAAGGTGRSRRRGVVDRAKEERVASRVEGKAFENGTTAAKWLLWSAAASQAPHATVKRV